MAFEYFKRSVAGAGFTNCKEQKEAKYKPASEQTLLSVKAKHGWPLLILRYEFPTAAYAWSLLSSASLQRGLGPRAKDKESKMSHAAQSPGSKGQSRVVLPQALGPGPGEINMQRVFFSTGPGFQVRSDKEAPVSWQST